MLQLVALDYPSNLFRHFVAIYLQTFMYDFFLINNKQITGQQYTCSAAGYAMQIAFHSMAMNDW
jgi:hypothetical protein